MKKVKSVLRNCMPVIVGGTLSFYIQFLQPIFPKMTTISNTKPTPKVYDFNQFLATAREMKLRKPSDVIMFCELIYGAAITCLKQFFLRKEFQIYISSHKANIDLMEVVTKSFKDPITSGQFSKAWKYAQNCHMNFYEMKNMKEGLKQNILNSVDGMNDLIEKADIDMINGNLGTLSEQIKERNTERTVDIGNKKFVYKKSASW